MPTTRPGFIWSGSEWVAIGQEAVVNPFYYQATAPTGAATGAIWIESDVDVPSVDSAQFLRWRKTMTGGETSLSGNDDSSLPLAYTPGYEQLYINGVLQVRGGDYTATTGTTVTGLTALVASDVVEVFSAVARTVADVYTQAQVNALLLATNPVGAVTSYAGSTAPTNWLLCDGSAVSRTTYASLFSVVSTTYGSGNGSTTFNLPDLRTRVPVGKNASGTFINLGNTGGAETHTLTSAEMPIHTHTQNAHSHSLGGGQSFGMAFGPNGGAAAVFGVSVAFTNSNTYQGPYSATDSTATNQNTGGSAAHNNLQPYIVMNYIIKAA